MIKHNQDGAVRGVGIALILTILLLVVAISFGGWAFASRQDYKNNVDVKIAAATQVAKQQEDSVKESDFAQREKFPLRQYSGPDAYGSLRIAFPKTWSGVVDDTGTSNSALVDGYFYPNIVPSISAQGQTFALRVQVLGQSYSQTLQDLQGNQGDNPPVIVAYALPKLPKVVGVKVSGALPNGQTGQMVVLPLRDKTLELWTEGSQFTSDFNSIILADASFSP